MCEASVTYKPRSTAMHDTRRSYHAVKLCGLLVCVCVRAVHSIVGPACVCRPASCWSCRALGTCFGTRTLRRACSTLPGSWRGMSRPPHPKTKQCQSSSKHRALHCSVRVVGCGKGPLWGWGMEFGHGPIYSSPAFTSCGDRSDTRASGRGRGETARHTTHVTTAHPGMRRH